MLKRLSRPPSSCASCISKDFSAETEQKISDEEKNSKMNEIITRSKSDEQIKISKDETTTSESKNSAVTQNAKNVVTEIENEGRYFRESIIQSKINSIN